MSHVAKRFRGGRVYLGGGRSRRASVQGRRLHLTWRSALVLGGTGDPAVSSCRTGPGDVGGGSDRGLLGTQSGESRLIPMQGARRQHRVRRALTNPVAGTILSTDASNPGNQDRRQPRQRGRASRQNTRQSGKEPFKKQNTAGNA
ncbi:hypothetical protein RF55_13299 [Lasius niger]|uniref:Uncharacterized protein n=1 Tax=Lasius niger TaxID=67767 RepID=A0A0J7KAH7_LASNI|nr:hypothetical protein RF55_13299 [Lasius niger]